MWGLQQEVCVKNGSLYLEVLTYTNSLKTYAASATDRGGGAFRSANTPYT